MNNLDFSKSFPQSDVEKLGQKESNIISLENFPSCPILLSSSTSTSNIDQNNLAINGNKDFCMPIDLTSLQGSSNMLKKETLSSGVPCIVGHKLECGKYIRIYKCKLCLKEFRHQYTLMRHLPTHTNERNFECNTCGKTFKQMSTLSQHKVIHSMKRPHGCEFCQKTFNRISSLISHKKIHFEDKPHKCNVCKKAFHQKGNLRNHLFTHTNSRPYKCDGCNAGFNQKSNLVCHKQKCHLSVDTSSCYCCQHCSKSFSKETALRNHEMFVHAKNKQSQENEQTICNAVFIDSIETKAMQLALATNQPPFALLRPLVGIPVLVRVLPVKEKKHMLVPATSEDFKKYSQIVVAPKVALPTSKDEQAVVIGSNVQIKIPVVATVIQQSSTSLDVCATAISQGPSVRHADLYNEEENNNYFGMQNMNGEDILFVDGEELEF